MKRNPLLFILLLLTLVSDIFLYKGVEILLFNKPAYVKHIWYELYILVSLFIVIYIFRLYWTKKHFRSNFLNVYATSIVAYFIAKFIYAIFTFLAYYKLENGGTEQGASQLVLSGLITGLIPLSIMLIGILRSGKRIIVKDVKIQLPYSFSRPVKIVQISDWHLGSFFNSKQVVKAIEMVNDLNADLVVFTGDLVNFDSSETQGFEKLLSEIKSKHKVLAILGNHDYGDYKTDWVDEQSKKDDVENLKLFCQLINWDLLLNEKRTVSLAGVDFEILGIENWGLKFRQAGSLESIDLDSCENKPTILLSHDPTYWDEVVLKKYPFIDLTLSGHTHGFQLAIEYKSFKWSPARFKYKRWAGLYKKNGQYLYVNSGLGYLGYPGRLGVPPEITVIHIGSFE